MGQRIFKYERRYYSWGNSYSQGMMDHPPWFSMLALVFDSVVFQIFPAHPTFPGTTVPQQAYNFQVFIFSRTHANHPLLTIVTWP